jgi:hypothetical protein
MLMLLLLWGFPAPAAGNLGGGPVKCDVASSCGAGATCCSTPGSTAGEWGCCPAPNATCCPDMLHCCPAGSVCGAGKCTAGRIAAETPHHLSLGRAPPPPPPPPLYPFECTTTRIGCYAEVGRQDGWINRTVAPRNMLNEPMAWGDPMSVTSCARFCHQGMRLIDWGDSGPPLFNVTLAGNHLCGCSHGVPPTDSKSALPRRLPDSLCDAPCPANSSETCGDANQTAVSAYAFTCTAAPAPLQQPICNLNFSQWWNGSVVSYKQYIDCFAKSDTAYASVYVNDHFAIQPHTAVLCNLTRDAYFCEAAMLELHHYARSGAPSTGYHCYEIVLAFASVRDGTGKKDAGMAADLLHNFTQKVYLGCRSAAGHSSKLENHALDGAIQEAYAPRILPELLKLGATSWKNQAEMVYQNWMHAHSLDESAINYDGISIVRLVALLRLGASDNPAIASMPDGPADLQSDKFKAFLIEFADALTPAGCLSNHGGGLQNDGQGFCNGAHLFNFFFEQGATSFIKSDPTAAQYFKWAARSMWQNMGVRDDFGSFYWSPVRSWEEEQKQEKAGGFPAEIPAKIWDITSKVVMKSEYQHGPHRQDGCYPGCYPKKLVLCNSRKKGSAYVQMDIYSVPPGYHGSAHQAATMNHYEFGQTLFFTGGMRTKHTSQDDTATGMPTIMPDSDDASDVFPWRWGQHNVAKGKVQTQDYPTLMFGETEHAPSSAPLPNGTVVPQPFGPGDWAQFWPVDMSFYQSKKLPKGQKTCPRGQSCGIVFGCKNVVGQNRSFTVAVGPLTLEGPRGTKVLDNFSYWKQLQSDPWGHGSSWLTTYPGSLKQPWLKIQCGAKAGDNVAVLRPTAATPSLDYQFEAYDYTHLRHQYMVDEDFVVDNRVGASSAGGGYTSSEYLDFGIPLSSSFGPVTNSFKPEMNDVVANTSAFGDSHGGFNMTDFGGFTYDTYWTRHMVLLREGGLIVLDSITPTALDGGWLGGPHWQFEANCSTNATAKRCQMSPSGSGGGGKADAGEDAWVDLSGFPTTTSTWERATGNGPSELYSLVAKFGGSPNRTHDVSPGVMAPPMSLDNCTVPGRHNTRQPCFQPGEWWGYPWQTLYTKQRGLAGGQTTIFTSAFIPYLRSKTTGAAVEAGVHITQNQEAGSAVVEVGPLTISLDVQGGWEVKGR